jgi:hypothetical protein
VLHPHTPENLPHQLTVDAPVITSIKPSLGSKQQKVSSSGVSGSVGGEVNAFVFCLCVLCTQSNVLL